MKKSQKRSSRARMNLRRPHQAGAMAARQQRHSTDILSIPFPFLIGAMVSAFMRRRKP